LDFRVAGVGCNGDKSEGKVFRIRQPGEKLRIGEPWHDSRSLHGVPPTCEILGDERLQGCRRENDFCVRPSVPRMSANVLRRVSYYLAFLAEPWMNLEDNGNGDFGMEPSRNPSLLNCPAE